MITVNTPSSAVSTENGINLVVDSDKHYENKIYPVARYTLTEDLEVDTEYTVTIFGAKLATGKTSFRLYAGHSGTGSYVTLNLLRDGIYSGVLVPTSSGLLNQEKNVVQIYQYPSTGSTETSRIDRIKIERGRQANPVWTPAPILPGKNLISLKDTRVGLILQDGSGTISSATGFRRTDFIEIEPDQKYWFSIEGTSLSADRSYIMFVQINFYAKESMQEHIISHNNGLSSSQYLGYYYNLKVPVTSPSDAHYAIVSFSYENIDPKDFKVKLEKGAYPTPWIPSSKDYPFYIADPTPSLHRSTYRGKYLGTAMTERQLNSIYEGTFEDIFVGDYWNIDSTVWRVMDIDYFYDNNQNNKHDIIIMPDICLGESLLYMQGPVDNSGVTNSIATLPQDALGYFDIQTDQNGISKRNTHYYLNEASVFGANMLIKSWASKYDSFSSYEEIRTRQLAAFALNPSLLKETSGYNFDWVLTNYRIDSSDSARYYSVVTSTGSINEVKVGETPGLRPAVIIAGKKSTTIAASEPVIVPEAMIMEAEPMDVPAPAAETITVAPEMHRNIFRGKDLGSTFTSAQKLAISAGTFDDLYVGDYWTIGNVRWRIADMDYWYLKGDTSCAKHHLVIIPDTNLYSHNMNGTNITTGAYDNSLMFTEGLEQAKTQINNAFGSAYILNHRGLFPITTSGGHPSSGAYRDSTVEIPNECMIYGHPHFTTMNTGTTVPYIYTIDHAQLALMQLVPKFVNVQRAWYWLRDVVSAASFADVDTGGYADCYGASHVGGVRPVFGLIGG